MKTSQHCNPVQGSTGGLKVNPCNENRIPAMRTGFPVIKTGMSLQCRKGSNSRISRIAQMNMNLLVIWSILSRELSKEDMELKLEIQGNFLLWSAAREGRISFRDLIGAIRIRVPYCTMAKLTKFVQKILFPFFYKTGSICK